MSTFFWSARGSSASLTAQFVESSGFRANGGTVGHWAWRGTASASLAASPGTDVVSAAGLIAVESEVEPSVEPKSDVLPSLAAAIAAVPPETAASSLSSCWKAAWPLLRATSLSKTRFLVSTAVFTVMHRDVERIANDS